MKKSIKILKFGYPSVSGVDYGEVAQRHNPSDTVTTQQEQQMEEKQKPLYGNKENMGIAHYLANDIVQLVEVLHSMYGDDNPHWERIKYDVQRLKSLLEEALQG